MKIVADNNIPHVVECFSTIGEVETASGRQITPKLIKNADVLLVRTVTKVGQDLLSGSSVKFVGTATIGFEHIDKQYLDEKNIAFASAPGSNANSVAEYVVAALLSCAEKQRITLAGKSIGIIGVGSVGSRVEKKLRALEMKPVLNDPPLYRQTHDQKYRPLEELFDCELITLHTPLTFEGKDKTYHLADKSFFNSIKNGCGFLNTSRGAVVDTSALKQAINSGKSGPVILDVWENEPDIDLQLLKMVDLATPHIAGYSLDGKINGMIMIYQALCRYLDIKPDKAASDFLPEPEEREITIETDTDDEQQIIRKTVEQIYPIDRDDSNTRKIEMVPPNQRPEYFENLRKNYPVRREFHNTTVKLKNPKNKLPKKLEGIGFRLSEQ